MKKVSAKTFFTVLWRGVCQALGWFFGLFGYKRDGKFAKCVWGLFATSAAVVMGIIAIITIYEVGEGLWDKYKSRAEKNCCGSPYGFVRSYVSGDIYYHDHRDGHGYIYNDRTGKKLIKNVAWISEPRDKDTLVCFSDGKKRGYFGMKSGRVVVEPKYDHAWVFSEGLAGVDDGGIIKFIDATGKVVVDNKMAYNPNMDGYVFHGGYCVIDTEDGEKHGLMNRTGEMVLPLEYDYISAANDYELWRVRKEGEMAVFDKEMKFVVPFLECTSIYIDEGTIDVTMDDHTMRKYDMDGALINDFYISSIRMLEYEKENIVYKNNQTENDDEDEYDDEYKDYYHPRATARLRAYVAGDCFEGLMTADGHMVTLPMYKNIFAIGYDLYLCESTNVDRVIVNGKGEIVR